ncbi:protein of unknown function DUF1667 [Thermosinus carboxydivorans Nor1]|uniref:Molybdopterin oxidoreductase n=1 Tax=Thermosinus carboxydivorans Nor1 TaxID=401526 RepID=A1HRV1_9FIRM|nr:DUF1667 domain-containing protein [Thermosinus carboxydivorans]EAX47272.1 protein of unknown function DUF1667 [Thermosinus carboxydivorans Nor1]
MSEIKRRISCIVCPLSCEGEIILEGEQITAVTGFTCPRGQQYAREEVTAPKRMLTTTVRVVGGQLPLLPVVSKGPLPKDKIVACARFLSTVTVTAPVSEGNIICENILGLGVDIVASRDLSVVDKN